MNNTFTFSFAHSTYFEKIIKKKNSKLIEILFYNPFTRTGNLIVDDSELPMKNWRNKHPPDNEYNDFDKFNGVDTNADDVPFLQQFPVNYHPQHPQKQNSAEDKFSVSVYILLVLTFVVILLFLNCYRKGRNNIRTRRKYFLINWNKLGL